MGREHARVADTTATQLLLDHPLSRVRCNRRIEPLRHGDIVEVRLTSAIIGLSHSGNSTMPGPKQPVPPFPTRPGTSPRPAAPSPDDAVACERCGAEMFRMHAVWRCPSCGYKTDCCGW